MSLDISLYGPLEKHECECEKCGDKHETEYSSELFSANITHNLARMANAAGIYDCLWRPAESLIIHAHQIIQPLRNGIALMESDPSRFKKLDAANGWGTYETFLPWLKELLAACEENPGATVKAYR